VVFQLKPFFGLSISGLDGEQIAPGEQALKTLGRPKKLQTKMLANRS